MLTISSKERKEENIQKYFPKASQKRINPNKRFEIYKINDFKLVLKVSGWIKWWQSLGYPVDQEDRDDCIKIDQKHVKRRKMISFLI